MTMLLTALHPAHEEAGAQLVDFHGWRMPLRYRTIADEHHQVRRSAGIFDLCHMARIEIDGADSGGWVDHLITNDLGAIAVGQARYSLITNERGGIIDDIVVYRLPRSLFIIANAANRTRVIRWFEDHKGTRRAAMRDRTMELSMLAIQGPLSAEILGPHLRCDPPLDSLKYYRAASGTLFGVEVLVARTGYTGEVGYEVFPPADQALTIWRSVLQDGRIAPIGLGARDTLRLEAGMPLYGNDIDEQTNPLEAGLEFAVKLEKEAAFVGRDALRRIAAEGPSRRRVGLRILGPKVARHGMSILDGDRVVGRVTSGAPSPTLGYPIAMGYVDAGSTGGRLDVEIRGTRVPAEEVPLPFYSRTRRSSGRTRRS